jgi:Flp pilus assembly pilin Flp
MKTVAHLIRDEAGETAAHYALIAIVLAIVGLVAAATIGANVKTH